MGGRIDLTSSSKGTTFAISLPCPTMALESQLFEVVGREGEDTA
jgi:hypothetical protein